MENKETKLFRKIIWFDKNICDATFFADLEPKREVSKHPRFKSGDFYSQKCKKDVSHESGLEEKFFKKLERTKRVLFYWEQPIKAPYRRGRVRSHTTPDAGVILNNLKVVIVEVKPLSQMLEYKVQMKVEGLLKFCAENGCGFLFTDGTDTIDKIKKVKCNRKLEKEILSVLGDHILRKKECNEILKRHNATQMELMKIILKNQLKYKAFPFKLQHCLHKNDLFYKVFYKNKRYDDLVVERFSTLFK